ncbi:M56 family metallopeptidase [Microlunatus lacustris]
MVALALGVLGLVLAGPGPLWVERWRFLHRVPRAAVVLWQAGAVAALVSVVGAGLAVAVPVAARGWGELDALPLLELLLSALLAVFTAVVVLRLGWSLVAVARDTAARRRRHRAAVDLLGRVEESYSLPGLRVLAEQLPVAYCLPGLRGSRVVLSSGTLTALGTEEVRAVVAHESAHVRARHDLVLDTFTALHRAFPIAVRSEIPAQQCRLLVEMLADDAARRLTGAVPLARALVTLAGAPTPAGTLGAGGSGTAERIARLAEPARPHRLLSTAVYLLACGLVVFPVLIMLTPRVLG